MRTRTIALWLGAIVSFCNYSAEREPNSYWLAFRKAYPFHLQTMGISSPDASHSRTLIISEPPPVVSLDDIRRHNPVLQSAVTERQKVGYDGWLTDVVVRIPDTISEAEIQDLAGSLSRLLYGTAYKAHFMDLTNLPERALADAEGLKNLDLRATAGELRSWLIEDSKALFETVDGSVTCSLAQLRKTPVSVVCYLNRRGLILWWLPKDAAVADCETQIRQFATDGDLILGAVSNEQGLLIAARERQARVTVMPPLRAETIIMLATVKANQLEQSYERNHPLAGKRADDKDWAPILLSPELADSEYGSLLNITDQILKSWSLGGEITYDGFNYPQPKKFPFKGNLMEKLKTEELTFNWNTNGVGYSLDGAQESVYALNRTGALPVSYIPSENPGAGKANAAAVMSAEEDAYKYFAEVNDPHLTRVVQYAALYQIFLHYLQAPHNDKPRVDQRTEGLKQLVRAKLLPKNDPAIAGEIAKTAAVMLAKVLERVAKEDHGQELVASIKLEFHLEAIAAANEVAFPDNDEPSEETLLKIIALDDLSRIRIELGVDDEFEIRVKALAKLLGYAAANSQAPTDVLAKQISSHFKTSAKEEEEEAIKAAKELIETVRAPGMAQRTADIARILLFPPDEGSFIRKLIRAALVDNLKLPENYAADFEIKAQRWIHTGVVVVSWHRDLNRRWKETGGHNLYGRVTRFKPSVNIASGTVEIEKEINGVDLVILHNPGDAGKVAEIVRDAGRYQEDPTVLKAILNKRLAVVEPPKKRDIVDALKVAQTNAKTGGTEIRGSVLGAQARPGWWLRGELTPSEAQLAKLHGKDIVVQRNPDGTHRIIFNGNARSAVTAADVSDGVESVLRASCIGRDAPATIVLSGFNALEGTNLRRSLTLRMERQPLAALVSEGQDLARYDVAKAALKLDEATQSITITIPSASPATAPATYKVKVTAGEIIARVKEKLSSFIDKAGRDPSAQRLREFHQSVKQLKKEFPNIDIDVQAKDGVVDNRHVERFRIAA